MAFAPDGFHAVKGSGMTWSHEERKLVAETDNTIRLWDLATGDEVRRFAGHFNWVNSVAISPDGNRILSGGGGHIEEDGRWTAGSDTSIRIWELRSGEEIRRFPTNDAPVLSVAFSPMAASPCQGVMTASSACGGSRSDGAFCESRGRNGKDRGVDAKFVKHKSKPKTIGFYQSGCWTWAITPAFSFWVPYRWKIGMRLVTGMREALARLSPAGWVRPVHRPIDHRIERLLAGGTGPYHLALLVACTRIGWESSRQLTTGRGRSSPGDAPGLVAAAHRKRRKRKNPEGESLRVIVFANQATES